ncbi:MAG: GH25 family lysozyme [Faecousia sp.]
MRQRTIHIRSWAAALSLALLLSLFSGCGGPSRVTRETEKTTFGIDVAKYQGTIDWAALARSGIDFAIVRLGYRTMSDGVIQEDSNGRYNLQEGSKAGIPLGVYFFSSAVTEEEAVEEANWVAEIIAQYPITYPVVYDCEGFLSEKSRQFGMTKEARTDVALAFLKAIEKLGYEGMFYSSKHELENEWDMERIEKNYKIWVAQYPQTPYPGTAQSSYTGTHHMWQYSKEGSVEGITQPVDLNVAYFGYDGIEPAKDSTPPEEVGPDVEALMDFTQVSEEVTAKVETNLRDRPNQDPDSQILYTLQNGEVAQRIAVSSSGWSKLIYEGNTYYAVTSYLTTDLNYDPGSVADPGEDDGIQTQFTQVNYSVTAKKVVNLRKLPSVENEDAEVIAQLQNGDIATCIGVSDNGWSKLIYNGTTCYAVTSYLVPTDGTAVQTQPEEGIKTQFEEMNDRVTAKVEVNLRSLPSVEDPDCVVVATLKNGEVVTRTGINRDLGWSRVDYNGQTLYCVSSYLTAAE